MRSDISLFRPEKRDLANRCSARGLRRPRRKAGSMATRGATIPLRYLGVAREDGHEDTWQPRLTLAGADLDRIHTLELDEFPPGWNVRDGIDDVRRAIIQTSAKLVMFDALLDHVPPPVGGENINSATF